MIGTREGDADDQHHGHFAHEVFSCAEMLMDTIAVTFRQHRASAGVEPKTMSTTFVESHSPPPGRSSTMAAMEKNPIFLFRRRSFMPSTILSGTHTAANVNLTESHFLDVCLTGAQFDDVNLRGSRFRNVNFAGAQFEDVNLSGVAISNADIEGMTIDGVLIADLLAAYRRRD